ncbi:MAG: hypothetical protein ACREBR_05760 [bacterium]
MKKICGHYKIEKDITEFGKHSSQKDGLRFYCRKCTNLIQLDYITNNKENRRQIQLRSYHKHRGSKKLAQQAFRKTAKGLLSVYKESAKNRNLPFKLVLEDFENWLGKTNCYYCTEFIPTVGLDRYDNDQLIGYTKENVVPCCRICNRMKMDLTIEMFQKKIELIYNNLSEVTTHGVSSGSRTRLEYI